MSERDHLPALVTRFGTALSIGNRRKRTAAIEKIFGELDQLIEATRSDYGLVLRAAITHRQQTSMAESAARDARGAVETAVEAGMRDAAVRHRRRLERLSRDVEHHRAHATANQQRAVVQQRRAEDLYGLRQDLRRRYEHLELRAIDGMLEASHLDELAEHARAIGGLTPSGESPRSRPADPYDRFDPLSDDRVVDIAVLGQRSARNTAEAEVDRMLRDRAG